MAFLNHSLIKPCGLIFLLFWHLIFSNAIANSSRDFPLPNELKADVKFWTRVYTEVDTQEGFIHDKLFLNIVYERVSFTSGTSEAKKENIIKRKKEHYAKILSELSSGRRTSLSLAHKRVLRIWPSATSNNDFKMAKDRLRFQLGQSDRFKQGLVRSGRWQPFIYAEFKKLGIPKQLASLPHVESSFVASAKSHAGAAGLWQFTRPTGQRFMRIDHLVDERLDPFIATKAAGLLLKNNYKVTETWPLALTAYNHGASGTLKASKIVGSTDISKVVRQYKGRNFGFASRNFYNAFKAAQTIDSNPSPYFGNIKRDAPLAINQVTLPSFYTAESLMKAFSLKNNIFKSLNPALQAPILTNSKLVPKGYPLRIESSSMMRQAKQLLKTIPAVKQQIPDLTHRVSRGEALSTIARRYNTSVSRLMYANRLANQHKIHIGQILKLPGSNKPAKRSTKNQTKAIFYTVKKGDRLSIIAKMAGVLEADVIALNRIKNRHQLYAGQKLRLR